ncbi:MAG: sigma-70 family RNA polymerase sigma factor [Planctomycetes bacterium]|nr:sigma-70 family RNA polymerase sigma factor [Planctomycetota bacterium]
MDLGALYDEWASRLLGYMMAITRDRHRAEDALQNLFVKLATSEPEMREPAVYLFRAARNEAIRAARRREGPLPPEILAPATPDASEVASALSALPPEQAEAIVLHAMEGFAFREVGEILGIPQDTAASRYRYGIEKLREIWKTD